MTMLLVSEVKAAWAHSMLLTMKEAAVTVSPKLKLCINRLVPFRPPTATRRPVTGRKCTLRGLGTKARPTRVVVLLLSLPKTSLSIPGRPLRDPPSPPPRGLLS